jgi:phytoene dehydrogenase-like protein
MKTKNVIVIGAGVGGITAAIHLETRLTGDVVEKMPVPAGGASAAMGII